jgi:hypothetical protein
VRCAAALARRPRVCYGSQRSQRRPRVCYGSQRSQRRPCPLSDHRRSWASKSALIESHVTPPSRSVLWTLVLLPNTEGLNRTARSNHRSKHGLLDLARTTLRVGGGAGGHAACGLDHALLRPGTGCRGMSMHASSHASTHARKLASSHASTHARKHARTQARTLARKLARKHASTHVRTHARTHARKLARTHARKHARTHASSHARKLARARTHTHAPLHFKSRGPFTALLPMHPHLRRLQPRRNGSIPPRNSHTERGRSVLGVTESAPPPHSQPGQLATGQPVKHLCTSNLAVHSPLCSPCIPTCVGCNRVETAPSHRATGTPSAGDRCWE